MVTRYWLPEGSRNPDRTQLVYRPGVIDEADRAGAGIMRATARWVLALGLAFAGVSHFTNSQSFQAQVPPWMPWPGAVIAVSGVVEVALAVALLALPRWRPHIGWIVAAFFVVVFPGNVSQFITQTSAFGLDTDLARGIRLLFQPVLVAWALWCTGAWRAWRGRSVVAPG